MLVEFRNASEGLKVVVTLKPNELDTIQRDGSVHLDEFDEDLHRILASRLDSIEISLGQ